MFRALTCLAITTLTVITLSLTSFAAVTNNYVIADRTSKQLINQNCTASKCGTYYISVYNHGRVPMQVHIDNGAYGNRYVAAGKRIDIRLNARWNKKRFNVKVYSGASSWGKQYVQVMTSNGSISR